MASRILVSGAAGRIGRRVVERLLAEGHSVTALDLLPLGLDHKQLHKVTGALENTVVAKQAVEGIDIIFHLGAYMSWLAADSAKLFRANVEGTRTLLEAAANAGVKRFVFASSGEVYPENAPHYLPIDEAHPLQPNSVYGLTKLLGEEMLQFYARTQNFQITILRFAHTQDATELLDPDSFFSGPRFFLRAKIDQQIKFGNRAVVDLLREYDDGTEKLVLSCNEDGRPYKMGISDSRDIVEAILLTIKHPLAVGQTFNVGANHAVDFADALPRMAELTGLPLVRVNLPGAGVFYETSNRALRDTLGFKSQYSFDMMLQEAAQTWQQR